MYKVLIVDDEHIERSYLKYILEKNNTEFTTVGEASNGRFAIDLFIDQKPDIVIMDISMPIINGIDAAIEIKRINPSTIIILNTAYAEFEFAQKAINHNMNAYILKPSSEAEILTTLRTCITTASTSNSLYTTYSNTSTLNSTDIIKHYIEK